MNDPTYSSRTQEQQRETTRDDDEATTRKTYRENDGELTGEELDQEELRIFGLENDEAEPKNEISDSVLMTLNEEEIGLISGKKGHFKCDILEKNTWIGDTDTSTHMGNSDEGMFNCQETVNQYIKVGSGERLQIMKKGCKRCIISQKNRVRLHVVRDNFHCVPKLWYNLFSILEALRRGWSLGNKGMHVTISKGGSTIDFGRLSKCPTGHFTEVKIKTTNEVGAVENSKIIGKISYEKGHSLLMHANADVTNKTLQRLGGTKYK